MGCVGSDTILSSAEEYISKPFALCISKKRLQYLLCLGVSLKVNFRNLLAGLQKYTRIIMMHFVCLLALPKVQSIMAHDFHLLFLIVYGNSVFLGNLILYEVKKLLC